MIAMALALEPAILVADEPTTALDVTTQAQILTLIRTIQQRRNMAVLFITHDFGVVADIADHVAVLQRGRLVESGSAEAVLRHPQHAYTRALLAAVPSLTPPARAPITEAPVALSVTNLAKTYATRSGLLGKPRVVAAVKEVSFSLRRGETLGIVGESGSGKSTTARLAIRLIEPDQGTVRLGSLDFTALKPTALRDERRRIQMIFQDPFASLNPRRTVEQIIAGGPIAHGTPARQARARARELLDLVGLPPSAAERYPNAFSGGQRQRIGIARALAMEPDVLVADEAVSALDVSVQAQVLALLEDLKARLGIAMLFITHDLRVAATICDRIAVMHRGEIVEMNRTEALFRRRSIPIPAASWQRCRGRCSPRRRESIRSWKYLWVECGKVSLFSARAELSEKRVRRGFSPLPAGGESRATRRRDVTATWPEDERKQKTLGSLAITGIEPDATCDAGTFDPVVDLPEGIAGPAGDPIFAIRSPAYAVSLSRRSD